jgi:hypothetical protein
MMASQRARIGVLFPLVLIAMIGGGSAFVWVQTKPVPPPPQPFQGGSQRLTSTFYLVPVTIDAAATTRSAAAVATRPATDLDAARAAWEDFIASASVDPECARLVGHMYGGLPAELVVVDAPTAQGGGAAMYLPPSAGHFVSMRISSLSAQETVLNQHRVLGPFVSVGVTVYVPDKRETIGGPGYFPSGGIMPSLEEVLSVLADDYFLRHGQPWMLEHGQVSPKRFKDPAAARRDLDRRINKLAENGEQMYGGLKPK